MTYNVSYTVEDDTYPFTIQAEDWGNYSSYRPTYPSSMWLTWLEYHRRHGGLMKTAHDIGAGSGIAAHVLSRYFSHVYVSDPGKGNIAAARQPLQPASKFSFFQGPGEQVWLPDESIDFACICIAIHWMDAETVLGNIAASLRPGGTLAVVSYSFLVNFPDCSKLNDIWAEILRPSVKGSIERGCVGPDLLKGILQFFTGLDGTPVDATLYEDINRLQLNMRKHEALPFCCIPHGYLELPESKIQITDHVRHMQDLEWRMAVDTPWLKEYLSSSNIPFDNELWNSDGRVELDRIISHELGGRVVVEWPVAMILATKRIGGLP